MGLWWCNNALSFIRSSASGMFKLRRSYAVCFRRFPICLRDRVSFLFVYNNKSILFGFGDHEFPPFLIGKWFYFRLVPHFRQLSVIL